MTISPPSEHVYVYAGCDVLAAYRPRRLDNALSYPPHVRVVPNGPTYCVQSEGLQGLHFDRTQNRRSSVTRAVVIVG